MAKSQQSRRGFLKSATALLGGAMGLVLAVPLVRYLVFPVGRKVVSDSADVIDVLDEGVLATGAPPVRVEIVAANVRNAWAVADNVPLGAAWVRKKEDGEVEALSSTCPHLGCAVDFDAAANQYKCPCHKSAFDVDGSKLSGPSRRGLDPLPVTVEDGRVKISWVRYRPNVLEREKV